MNPPASLSSIAPLIVFTVPMSTTFSPNQSRRSTLNVETLASCTYALSYPDPYFPTANLSPSCPSQIQYNMALHSYNINAFLSSVDAFPGPLFVFHFLPSCKKCEVLCRPCVLLVGPSRTCRATFTGITDWGVVTADTARGGKSPFSVRPSCLRPIRTSQMWHRPTPNHSPCSSLP